MKAPPFQIWQEFRSGCKAAGPAKKEADSATAAMPSVRGIGLKHPGAINAIVAAGTQLLIHGVVILGASQLVRTSLGRRWTAYWNRQSGLPHRSQQLVRSRAPLVEIDAIRPALEQDQVLIEGFAFGDLQERTGSSINKMPDPAVFQRNRPAHVINQVCPGLPQAEPIRCPEGRTSTVSVTMNVIGGSFTVTPAGIEIPESVCGPARPLASTRPPPRGRSAIALEIFWPASIPGYLCAIRTCASSFEACSKVQAKVQVKAASMVVNRISE